MSEMEYGWDLIQNLARREDCRERLYGLDSHALAIMVLSEGDAMGRMLGRSCRVKKSGGGLGWGIE